MYSERHLEVSNSGNGVHSKREVGYYGGGSTDALEMEPFQFKPTGPIHISASGNSSDEKVGATEWTLKNSNCMVHKYSRMT